MPEVTKSAADKPALTSATVIVVRTTRSLAAATVSLAIFVGSCASADPTATGLDGVVTDGDPSGVTVPLAEEANTQNDRRDEPSVPTTAPAATTTVATTTTSVPIPTPEECADEIPIDVRVGQLLFPVVTQSELPAATQLAAAGHIGGIVLLGSPSSTIGADLATLQANSMVGPSIVSVDEEGGRVQRVAGLVGAIPSARSQASNLTPDEVVTLTQGHAEQLGGLGFTMNLAPVLDLDTGVFIRDRAFSADPTVVSQYALATAQGIRSAGLDPVAKHFPGHGRGTDSHTGLPTVPPLSELRTADLLPFIDFIDGGGEAIMIGHVIVPDVTQDLPASLSREIITDLLRDELGFNGVVITDAFNMDAIAVDFTNPQAAEASIAAGVDLAMLGNLADVDATITQLIIAVSEGRIEEQQLNESFVRVLRLKGLEVCELPADIAPAIACNGVGFGACGAPG